jgi:hypothetical protein
MIRWSRARECQYDEDHVDDDEDDHEDRHPDERAP